MQYGQEGLAALPIALSRTQVIDFVSFFLLIQFVYFVFAHTLYASPTDEQTRKRSWIITTFSALCASTMALPFAFDLLWCGLDWRKVTPHNAMIANPLSMFFLAYLVSDLLTGVLCYRKFVNMSSGWVHHTLYAMFTIYWHQRGWSHAFATALIMEMPTWIMGLGVLNPRFRSYWAFTLSFLVTRIVFHLIMIASLMMPNGAYVNKDVPSRGPMVFCILALPMHLVWAYKSVRGLRRRMRKLKKEAAEREAARRAAIDEATRLLDSADELEDSDAKLLSAKRSGRTTPLDGLRDSDTAARARQMVSHAVYVLWRNAPEAWRRAYREQLEYEKEQGITPASLRRSTLVRRALSRHLLQGWQDNVPEADDDDDEDLDDWMSITFLSPPQHKSAPKRKIRIGQGIQLQMPRELGPLIKGQKYVVSEFPVEREAAGTRRQRLVGEMRRRFEVARRNMVVF